MKLINSHYEIIPQEPGLKGMFKQIERAGRVCYKSEDKMTETSAEDFTQRMIKSGHLSMLEHGTLYLFISPYDYDKYEKFKGDSKYYCNNGTGDDEITSGNFCVTTNLRYWLECGFAIKELHNYICEPTGFHEKRESVKLICDRAIANEFVRHRIFSYAQESTRYCNYSKKQFNHEITYICPAWMTNLEEYMSAFEDTRPSDSDTDAMIYYEFLQGLSNAEEKYFTLLTLGLKPEEARAVLPLDLKTELFMTGFLSDWNRLLDVRVDGITGKPHPECIKLLTPLRKDLF